MSVSSRPGEPTETGGDKSPPTQSGDRSLHSTGRRSGWVAWIVVIAAISAGGWYFRKNFIEAPPTSATTTGNPGGGRGGRGGAGGRATQVVVASTQRGDMPVYLRGLGSAAAYNTVTVKSRVDGQIIKVDFTEGQFVKAGDLLIEIDPRPFEVQLAQAQGQMARDTALLNDARAIYNRNVTLFQEQVIAKAQVLTSEAQVGVYEGAIKSDEAQIANARLQLTYCKIPAPIGGRIGLRMVDPGNIIRAADPTGVAVITQLQPITVLFTLPQDSLTEVYSKLRAGQKLNVEAFDRDSTTKIATGKLLTIDNQIDSSTGTYKLKAVFDNDDHKLFPNQFLNIRMLLDTRRGLTIAPASAIQRGPKGNYVYLVEDKKAKVRPVQVAITEGENVGIVDGLEPGSVVVTDGQDRLQDGSPVDTGSGRGGRSGRSGGGEATGEGRGGEGRGGEGGGRGPGGGGQGGGREGGGGRDGRQGRSRGARAE